LCEIASSDTSAGQVTQPVGDAAQPVDCGIVGSRHHPDPRCGMAVTPFLDDAATILPVAPVAAGLAPA